jgi:hypothetical protein
MRSHIDSIPQTVSDRQNGLLESLRNNNNAPSRLAGIDTQDHNHETSMTFNACKGGGNQSHRPIEHLLSSCSGIFECTDRTNAMKPNLKSSFIGSSRLNPTAASFEPLAKTSPIEPAEGLRKRWRWLTRRSVANHESASKGYKGKSTVTATEAIRRLMEIEIATPRTVKDRKLFLLHSEKLLHFGSYRAISFEKNAISCPSCRHLGPTVY